MAIKSEGAYDLVHRSKALWAGQACPAFLLWAIFSFGLGSRARRTLTAVLVIAS